MIDIESQVFQPIANLLRIQFRGIFVTGEYVRKPSTFPTVSIVEMDNMVLPRGRDSGMIENFAEVMYQVDVYSNLRNGRKAQCKAIIASIDAKFAELGFTRSFLNPVPNMDDATIYRMTGRYRAVVSKDEIIYRR